VHKQLPQLSDYPKDFGIRGYKGKRGYSTDEESNLTTVDSWLFEKPGLVNETERLGTAQILSQQEEVAYRAIMNNDARKAVDSITLCIDKHDYSSLKLMGVKLARINVGMIYTWRAWCNWQRVMTGGNMNKTKKLKFLEQVLYDCGFVTGIY
jgi:hypothetical protein